jgi:UV DNA damage endonuclease
LPLIHALQTASDTWYKNRDGIIMIDYSNQEPNKRKGKHSNTLDMKQFKEFVLSITSLDLDIMLEVKDKEKSAKNAIKIINQINCGL